VERLKDQHLEQQYLVPRLAAAGGTALAGLLKGRAQPVAGALPGDHAVDRHQRIGPGVQALIAAAEVEEAGMMYREAVQVR
jgi:hypothetical protein